MAEPSKTKKVKKPVKKTKDSATKTTSTVKNNSASGAQPFYPKVKANNKDVSGRVKAAPSTRMAGSASQGELQSNRDANAMMLAAANMQVPMEGGTQAQAQGNVANTAAGNIGAAQAQHFAAGNDMMAQPPMPASGDLRQRILQTIALQPMYANPAQQGGTVPWSGTQKSDQTERDFQVQAHNRAQGAGLHEYDPADMKSALMGLLNSNDMGEGDPIDEVTQAAINRARAEQSIMASRQLDDQRQGQPALYPEPTYGTPTPAVNGGAGTTTPQPPKPKMVIPTRR
jgi:hypothetical protein